MIETIYDSEDCVILHGDCLEFLKTLPDKSIPMTMCSPPYEDCRLYGDLNFKVKGEDWVKWAFERYMECVRVTSGVTVWVVEGKTRDFRYSATPILLMADLHRAGVKLRKPPIYYRFGIPGSSPDWFKNVYEWVICSTHGKLDWSDNTAMGHPCKYPVGGEMSYRNTDGARKNERHRNKVQTRRKANRERLRDGLYTQPELANPGNVIVEPDAADEVIECGAVGGGLMGSKLASGGEAPYSEYLCEYMIRSFCPPGGIVLDIFGGSGTTGAAALKHGRKAIMIDVRRDQCDLMVRRIEETRQKIGAKK